MGPDGVANYDHLKKAAVCIQQFMDELNNQKSLSTNGKLVEESNKPIVFNNDHSSGVPDFKKNVLEELCKITNTLTKLIKQKNASDVSTGKMKCTHCGASSLVIENGQKLDDRKRVKEEDDDSKSSAAVSRIDSVESVENSLFEQSIKSESSVGYPDEEETMKDEDIVVKSIFNSTIENNILNGFGNIEANGLDQLLQKTILPDMMPIKSESSEKMLNDSESIDDKNVISNILEKIFGNQFNMNNIEVPKSESPIEVPAVNSFDNFGVLEALFNDSMNGFEPSTSEGKSRKRKSTPSKVPKTENGNGYVCPMEGCNKIFKEKGSVHRHFVTHIGMRFNCDQCKASYTQKHALMLHQKIHSNPDAYQCRGCGTNYTTQNGLRLHRQRNPACMELTNELQNLASQQNESAPIKNEPLVPIIGSI